MENLSAYLSRFVGDMSEALGKLIYRIKALQSRGLESRDMSK